MRERASTSRSYKKTRRPLFSNVLVFHPCKISYALRFMRKEGFMASYDRQRRKDLDQLVEEYVNHNMVGRREFMRRAMTAGLSVSAASALLVACGGTPGPASGGTPAKVTSIDALTQWSG